MSILIRGMEMPKDDFEVVMIYSDGSVSVRHGPYGKYYVVPIDSAKAVEIKTPHGRLIDADALIEEIDDRSMSDSDWWYEDRIDEMPTIVPAEGGADIG